MRRVGLHGWEDAGLCAFVILMFLEAFRGSDALLVLSLLQLSVYKR
jgi:hypothetical protein